jgi:hypothetical protein
VPERKEEDEAEIQESNKKTKATILKSLKHDGDNDDDDDDDEDFVSDSAPQLMQLKTLTFCFVLDK